MDWKKLIKHGLTKYGLIKHGLVKFYKTWINETMDW